MLQLLPFLYKQQLNKIKFLHENPIWKIFLSPDRAKTDSLMFSNEKFSVLPFFTTF